MDDANGEGKVLDVRNEVGSGSRIQDEEDEDSDDELRGSGDWDST